MVAITVRMVMMVKKDLENLVVSGMLFFHIKRHFFRPKMIPFNLGIGTEENLAGLGKLDIEIKTTWKTEITTQIVRLRTRITNGLGRVLFG
ncbi:MAG: hypothetical protein UX11_C0016G0007 [Candidatus Collierbacteria bacterium GW2011_GWC2_45_40]|nr:MAG: hypothetical protein UX11_C0016G0007 [Candidatus Collierbacteria bacterium GW2011_GWC2_45_40]